MAELVDAADSKSAALKSVWVRVPLPAPHEKSRAAMLGFFVLRTLQAASVHMLRIAATGVIDAAVLGISTTYLHRRTFGLIHFFRRAGDIAVRAPSQGNALIMVGLTEFALPAV